MKKNIFLFITALLLVISEIKSQIQTPSIVWQHTLASRGYRDNYKGVIETPDKSLICVGSYGVADYDCADLPFIEFDTTLNQPVSMINGEKMLIAKYDSAGNLLWKKALGGNRNSYAKGIFADASGNYVIYGIYNSNCCDTSSTSPLSEGRKGLWLVKINELGTVLYQKSFGYPTSSNLSEKNFTNEVIPTRDGGMLAVGCINNFPGLYGLSAADFHGSQDGLIIKLDPNWNIVWIKCYGGSKIDWFGSANETTDGNYQIIGASSSVDGDLAGLSGVESDYDAWILKISDNGNILGQNKIGAANSYDFAENILQTNDNGFIINIVSDAGIFNLPGSPTLYSQFVVKYSENGMMQWVKDYDNIGLYGSGDGIINDGT